MHLGLRGSRQTGKDKAAAHLGKVRLRSSLMKSWLPFCTGFTSGVCPGPCLCQVRLFFTVGRQGHVSRTAPLWLVTLPEPQHCATHPSHPKGRPA